LWLSEKVTVASLAEKLRKRPKQLMYISDGRYIAASDDWFEDFEGDFAKLQKQLREMPKKLTAPEGNLTQYAYNNGFNDAIKKVLGGEAE